jgi:ketosteroid isomerase-like protein
MANGIESSAARVLATVERLRDAINAHDIDAMVGCFDFDVRSEQPAHPARGFQGSQNIRLNWTMIFAGVPDIRAEILRTVVQDRNAWVEWCWSGSRRDGQPFSMRGVTVQEIDDDRIMSVSLYMEPVEVAGDGNPTAIRKATGDER